MGFLYDWFEERFQVQSIGDDILSKFVPAHVNIFYCFGGIVLTCFLVQAATGFGLTLFYRPTVLEAYTSVQFIVTDVNLGWLVRSMHRWSSGLMFLCLLSTCVPSVPDRWVQEAKRAYLGLRCLTIFGYFDLWCHRLLWSTVEHY